MGKEKFFSKTEVVPPSASLDFPVDPDVLLGEGDACARFVFRYLTEKALKSRSVRFEVERISDQIFPFWEEDELDED